MQALPRTLLLFPLQQQALLARQLWKVTEISRACAQQLLAETEVLRTLKAPKPEAPLSEGSERGLGQLLIVPS